MSPDIETLRKTRLDGAMQARRIRDIRNEELIKATILAIHRLGYGNVTLSGIAKEIGVSAASINYYFGTKNQLLAATMRHLMSELKSAMLERYEHAKTPQDRLNAVIEANFSDRLFTKAQCSVWVQFWSAAPYDPNLARLHRINRARVLSHFRAELRAILPPETREKTREALQAYMDGIWVEAAQAETPCDASLARHNATRFAETLLSQKA